MSTHHQAWANVAIFERPEAAESLAATLRAFEIGARVYNDKALQRFLFLCPPRLTFRVQVRGEDHQRTANLLENQPPPVSRQAIHCPDCGSLRVNYPQMTRKFILPTVLVNLGIIFRVIHHEAYCDKCHFIFNLPDLAAGAESHGHAPHGAA